MTTNLRGKVALITGASRGIGAAIAERLPARNAKMAINYASSPATAMMVLLGISNDALRTCPMAWVQPTAKRVMPPLHGR